MLRLSGYQMNPSGLKFIFEFALPMATFPLDVIVFKNFPENFVRLQFCVGASFYLFSAKEILLDVVRRSFRGDLNFADGLQKTHFW